MYSLWLWSVTGNPPEAMQRGLGEPVPPKGVSPMSNWRGSPHERLHQDKALGVTPLIQFHYQYPKITGSLI